MKNKRIGLPLFILIFCMCANQGMPPGGLVDKTPPKVLSTHPEMAQVSVPLDSRIEFLFNEAINPQKAVDAVFITPFPGEDVKIRLRGKKLSIAYENGLKPDKTYVITLGTDFKDYQNNALEESYTLAFTTGDQVDEGRITGQVFGLDDARGVDVWAYPVTDSIGPNPADVEPEYVVQCSQHGEFQFKYLTAGTYRLFAIRDRVADRLYQKVEDEIGVAPKDVFLTASNGFQEDSLFLQIFREDTTSPTLLQAKSLHKNLMMFRFDESVIMKSDNPIQLVDLEDSSKTLKINRLYPDADNKALFYGLTEIQPENTKFSLWVKDVFDKSGNALDTSWQSIVVNTIAEYDTVSPEIIRLDPLPGEKSVHPEKIIQIIFSEPLDTASVKTSFFIKDSSETPIPGKVTWKHPQIMMFDPDKVFDSKMKLSIHIKDSSMTDLYGNFLADTLYSFVTLDKDTLSEVLGELIDPVPDSSGQYVVTLCKTDQSELIYQNVLPKCGVFEFNAILPGQYLISAMKDVDCNGIYSYGYPFPYQPSECYIQLSDTIKVRSRWSNSGNTIRLP